MLGRSCNGKRCLIFNFRFLSSNSLKRDFIANFKNNMESLLVYKYVCSEIFYSCIIVNVLFIFEPIYHTKNFF